MSAWRVMAVQDDSTFMLDQIKIFIGYRNEYGFSAVVPLVLELTEPVADTASRDVEPTVIPRELAEELFQQLSYALLGIAEPYREITHLRRENTETKKMLADLIAGIGRLGKAND